MTDIIIPDAIFPSDNIYGIPSLDEAKQVTFFELPIAGWGSLSRRDRMKGTWHFYVDDYKFNGIWKCPETLLQTKAVATTEVNFSLNDQMPLAEAIYRTFKKRWMSRFWQEYGMVVIADLNVPAKHTALNLFGVPKGWYTYSTWATDAQIETLYEHARIGMEHAAWNCDLFRLLVYGGGRKVKEACMKNDWVHIEDARHAAAKKKADLTKPESEGIVDG